MRYGTLRAMALSFLVVSQGCEHSTSEGDREVPRDTEISAENREGGVTPPENAALQYWQSFALLPRLDEEQEQILKDWRAPIDVATRELLEESRTALMYIRRAAQLRHCDWGLDYRDGVLQINSGSPTHPHLWSTRLGTVAVLDIARDALVAEVVRLG